MSMLHSLVWFVSFVHKGCMEEHIHLRSFATKDNGRNNAKFPMSWKRCGFKLENNAFKCKDSHFTCNIQSTLPCNYSSHIFKTKELLNSWRSHFSVY